MALRKKTVGARDARPRSTSSIESYYGFRDFGWMHGEGQ